MEVREAYNLWAQQYDTNKNRTRDLEAVSLRETIADLEVNHCLEVGCGTGKNTQWLLTRARQVTAVDLSEEMLLRAKAKVTSDRVRFHQADITQPWSFVQHPVDLITFSLVLEHIQDLTSIFRQAAAALAPRGYVYVGELHPFKQYAGTKARFETQAGLQEVTCFTHHFSDFAQAVHQTGLQIKEVKEYFDAEDRTSLPRILTLLLQKA
ncbi:class I SAM-dependent methyltransferase [Rufibacter psychrotolerans]|uniref:class I SAM-dependent methyltransferase n=1 Tax=Rufibacter psychrotolerans TaxID=2812556 RepID=UPI0019677B43|nr:class I SAM-dependent methyltransferase [Rufibacter sp. SYSU D00308]